MDERDQTAISEAMGIWLQLVLKELALVAYEGGALGN